MISGFMEEEASIACSWEDASWRKLVSRPFPSWNRSILTEIYLCHACSCQEILRTETAGQVIIMGVGALLGAAPQLQPADVTGPWLQPVLGMALRLSLIHI